MDTNELISIRNGDKSAYAEILKRFEPLIKSEVSECVRRLPAESDADPEELTSEAMLALYKAAVSYEPTEKVTFGLYAKICIHNRLISCVRKISSKRRRREREEKQRQHTAEHTGTPEEYLLAQANGDKAMRLLEKCASEYERTVFSLYMQKKSYAEIAASTGRSVKSVGNAIYRVKNKLRRTLSGQ